MFKFLCNPFLKRTFCVVLCLILLLPVLCVSSFAAESIVYNLSDFNGKYMDARNAEGYSYVSFDKGGFPLSVQTSLDMYSTEIYTSYYTQFFHAGGISIPSGSFVEVNWLFPGFACSYADVSSWAFILEFYDEDIVSGDVGASPFTNIKCMNDGDVSVSFGSNLFLSVPSVFDQADFAYTHIKDSSGNILGIKFSGTLINPIVSFYCGVRLNYSALAFGPVGTASIMHDSVDDLNITVYADGNGSDIDVGNSSISSLVVESQYSSVYPGTSVPFTATVSGTGEYDSSVTWAISGATASDTVISDAGELTVSPEETSSAITVTATSVQDPTVSGSYSLTVTPFPSADELVLFPGYSTALEGVAFVQQFTIGYKDGTPFEHGNPVWSARIYAMDATLPTLEDLPSWASISETGVLSLTAEAVAGYRIVPYAKLGSEIITGATVTISNDETDYLKDIINGTDEQQGEASDFKDKANSDAEQMQDAIDQLDQVTMPNIDDVDIDVWNMIDAPGFAAINSILGVVWSNNIVMTVITFAFILAMVGFFIFGKR